MLKTLRGILAGLASLLLVAPLLWYTVYAAGGNGPKVQSNSQVNMTAPAASVSGYVDNFPVNKQNEPAIARDPITGAFVAGSNDEIDLSLCGQNPPWDPTLNDTVSCHFDPFVGISGVYFSSDGVHWTQPTYTSNTDGVGPNPIHTLPGYDRVGIVSSGDPAIAFGPTFSNGAFDPTHMTAYYANLAFLRQSPSLTNGGALVAVSRSFDDGHTWVDPVVVNGPGSTAGDFNDKDGVSADANPLSPFFGNVYACYTLFPGSPLFSPELSDRIMFTRSTDGGSTWSKVQLLSPSYNNNAVGGRQDCQIRTAPDGTVYVFWDDVINKVSQMVTAISQDGGQTFSKRITVGIFQPIAFPLPNALFRVFSFPAGAVDPATGQAYVVYSSEINDHAQLVLSTSTDRGQTWSQAAAVGLNESATDEEFFPAVDVSPNSTVVVSYNALRQSGAATFTNAGQPGNELPVGAPFGPGAVSQSTFVAVSIDHGASFSTIKASTKSGDPDGSSTNSLANQFLGDYTSIVATDHAAFPVWTDERNAVPCTAVDQYRAGVISKPNPDLACSAGFGNTDIFSALVTY